LKSEAQASYKYRGNTIIRRTINKEEKYGDIIDETVTEDGKSK